VAVAVVDAAGRPLAEATVRGDALAHPVRFGGRTLRAAAGAGPVRLRFEIGPGGSLYSFTVR
jgi:hypothetical protein